jgi:hypothetical protein
MTPTDFVAPYSASPFRAAVLRQTVPRLADEQVLQRRRAIDEAKSDIAHGTQQRRFVREQKFSELVASPIAAGVEPPPALVAVEHVGLPDRCRAGAASTTTSASAATSFRPMLSPCPAIG